jgi:sulfite exporter TauE/SafE
MGVTDGPTSQPRSLLLYQLSYNSGRISSYLLVGLLAGTLGAGLRQLGLRQLGLSPVADYR